MAKAAIQTVPTKVSVAKYLDTIKEAARKKDCLALKTLMQKITGKKPVMWGSSLIGFGSQTQRYASGREVEWLQIGFASRKAAISIYLTCDLDQYKKELAKLGTYTRGVGCLYIKTLTDIDLAALERLLRASLRQEKAKAVVSKK